VVERRGSRDLRRAQGLQQIRIGIETRKDRERIVGDQLLLVQPDDVPQRGKVIALD